MKATLLRAVLILGFGVGLTMFNATGVLLIVSTGLAYVVTALAFTPRIWRGG